MNENEKAPEETGSGCYRMNAAGAVREQIKRLERSAERLRALLEFVEEGGISGDAEEALWSLVMTSRALH